MLIVNDSLRHHLPASREFFMDLTEVEDADTPRVVFEERITMMRELWRAIDSMFEAFLKRRSSTAWESQTNAIRKWILQTPKAVAAVA